MKAVSLNAGFIKPSMVELTFEWFHRMVAVYCIVFGLAYWTRLIGIYPGELWRYDLMPLHWQLATVSLAVLFPIAGAGLWMVASWGPVIWFLCASIETVMYVGFPQLFGWKPAIGLCHLGVALVYAAFRTVIYLQKRAQT